ncbi:MAG: MnhB domain-containing protein [Candidatus Omnitrophota bacterium]
MKSDNQQGMSLIVQVITRITVGLILLYGIYIVMHGHLSPGGGFAGGVIIALSFVHMVIAFGRKEAYKIIASPVISMFESIGALAFLAIGLLCFVGGNFFYDWLPKGEPFSFFSGGTIILSNIAISFKVAFGLFAIFMVLIMIDRGEGE